MTDHTYLEKVVWKLAPDLTGVFLMSWLSQVTAKNRKSFFVQNIKFTKFLALILDAQHIRKTSRIVSFPQRIDQLTSAVPFFQALLSVLNTHSSDPQYLVHGSSP